MTESLPIPPKVNAKLIIITGLPCSGKSYRAQQISEYITSRIRSDPSLSKRTSTLIPSHHASQDSVVQTQIQGTIRDQVYNSAVEEKTARAEEFSAVKRAVSKDCTVIADGLNYIKGYRYQLWCEAKAAGTRCCVVHVAAREDECTEWNGERLRACGREDEIEADDGKAVGQRGNKIGKDIRGHLMPESHTAIYGDKLVGDENTSSRGSSTDGNLDDEPRQIRQQDDTMTLKSLYISKNASEPQATESSNGNTTLPPPPSTPSTTHPTIPIPPPTSSPPYNPQTLKSLFMRYEPPSPFTRWDTPLFTIPSSDAHPPYDSIWDAIHPPLIKPTSRKALAQQSAAERAAANATAAGKTFSNHPDINKAATAAITTVRPHAATVLPTATRTDALQLLESATLLVVQSFLRAARETGIGVAPSSTTTTSNTNTNTNTASNRDHDLGGTVTFPILLSTASPVGAEAVSMDTSITIPPGLMLNQPMLQRLRRKYTAMQRGGIAHGQGYVGAQGGIDGKKDVVLGFVEFLRREFGADEEE